MHTQIATTETTLSGTIGQIQGSRAVRSLQHVIGFPDSWTSFFMFLVVLLGLSGGLLLHIHLSAQLLQIQLQIDELERAYNEIEYQNAEIIWQISQSTAIDDVQQRALALGYDSTQRHYYVVAEEAAPTQRAPAQAVTAPQNNAPVNPEVNPEVNAQIHNGAPFSTFAVDTALSGTQTTWHSRLHGIGSRIQRWWRR